MRRALSALLALALPSCAVAQGGARAPSPVFLRAFADGLAGVGAGLRGPEASPLALEPVLPGLWSLPGPSDAAAAAEGLARATLAAPAAAETEQTLAARLAAQALADPAARAETVSALRESGTETAAWLAGRLEELGPRAQAGAELARLGADLARVPGLSAGDILAHIFDRAAPTTAPAPESVEDFAAWAGRRFAAGRLQPAALGVPSDRDLQGDVALSPLTNPEREKVIVELFRKAGARPEEIRLQDAGRGRHNVIVVKKGRSDRVVVWGGHHDKVSEGHGTIDNWTGATMVVNLYKALAGADTEATHVFVAFAREEEGLLGSDAYVASLSPEERKKIDAMVNLDTLGVDGTFSWKNNSDRVLLDAIQRTSQETGLALEEMVLHGGDSDSSSFRRVRIPAMTVLGASNEVIWDILHSARDTIAAFSLPHYVNAYKLTLALLKKLDVEPLRPRLSAAGIPGDSADDTPTLERLLAEVREGRAGPLPEAAFKTDYILMPGLNWDLMASLYYAPARERMRALGLSSARVDTDALGALTGVNARRLAAAVAAAARPVVLIGHSKGGLEIVKFLELYPELKAKVKAVVTIQSPHFGSHMADFFVRHPWLYAVVQFFGRLLHPHTLFSTNWSGWRATLDELGHAARSGARAAFDAADGVPLYSIATRHRSRHPIQRIKAWLGGFEDEEHDGLVAAADAVMPGSLYAILDRICHVGTIVPQAWRLALIGMNGPYPEFAADLAEAIVRWVHVKKGT